MKINSRNTNPLNIKELSIQRNLFVKIGRKLSYWSKYGSLVHPCIFLIFTILSITVGILTVYLVLRKQTNKACELNFQRMAPPDIGYDSNPHHVAVGDFTQDGHLDIVVANPGADNIGIFLGYGNGTFVVHKSYSLGYNARPQSVTIGYINNDRLLDIIVANYGSDYVEILLQTC